jgi:hypothetical protein
MRDVLSKSLVASLAAGEGRGSGGLGTFGARVADCDDGSFAATRF